MSRKREKRGSLNYQINQRMREMDKIGESRHEAVKDARENLGYRHNKTVGIHSTGTFETYKNVCKQFTGWIKENDSSVRNIEDIKEEHIKDYIQHRAEQGISSYTYSKDLAGLNKVFNTNVHKSDCDVANRSYKDISNNREMKEHHSHINYSNYQSEITVLKSTGVRRETMTKINANSFNYDDKGYPVSIRLTDERNIGGQNLCEKGGRARIAEIPEQYREELKTVIEEKVSGFNGDTDKNFFDKIPTRLGTHRFRQEYAKSVYDEYIEKNGLGYTTLHDTGIKEYEGNYNVEFRGFDVGALQHTTQMLGHNRLTVAVYHYIGKA